MAGLDDLPPDFDEETCVRLALCFLVAAFCGGVIVGLSLAACFG